MSILRCDCHNSINCVWCTPRCIGCIHNEMEHNKDSDINFDRYCYSCYTKLKMMNYKKKKKIIIKNILLTIWE